MANQNKQRLAVASLVISLAGLGFIQSQEGTQQDAYLDVVGVPTICTGSTKAVFVGQHATLRECEQRLIEDTSYAGKGIARLVAVRLTQGQYDALVSFVFNVGEGAFAKSTLLRRINEGQCLAAAKEFLRWDHAGGRKLRGLTKRRRLESDAFKEDCDAW